MISYKVSRTYDLLQSAKNRASKPTLHEEVSWTARPAFGLEQTSALLYFGAMKMNVLYSQLVLKAHYISRTVLACNLVMRNPEQGLRVPL